MHPNEPAIFFQEYFDAKTHEGVTATVRTMWCPNYPGGGLAFIDCHAWRGNARATEPVLEPRIRVLRSPTRNELLRLSMTFGEEWYQAVGRAVSPPQQQPQAKPKTA